MFNIMTEETKFKITALLRSLLNREPRPVEVAQFYDVICCIVENTTRGDGK